MGDLSGEPSMEDILSSIKRIIAEESDTPGRPKRTERPSSRRPDIDPVPRDDILELREPADGASPPIASQPLQPPAPPRIPELARFEDASPPPHAPVAPAEPAVASRGMEGILSQHTAAATRGPLDTLSRLVVKPEVAGSDTLEAMVREMLRPMLREWLDAHLPHMVEAMVAKEIDRITGK